ncbi:MAG: class I SAM-dependent methyltransferase [Candidatus Hydrogenedentes bacterium]|nr:class I SAM-dependent methyltransferase [Candidatus Hydrogenedentota bacterium]
MFEAYRLPRDFMPFWHFGARMGIGTVRRFLLRMRVRGFTNMLDAGTGGGANVLLAGWSGFRVTACDLSHGALQTLGQTAERAQPVVRANGVQANSLRLPFRDAAFDVVIASHIIEHLAEPGVLLYECARVLRTGGMLRVSCPSQWHAMRIGTWLGLRLDPDDHVVTGYEADEIATLLPENMHIRRVTYQGRVIESNVSDAQFFIARAMGMSGNPAVGDTKSTPPAWLYWMKEAVLVPFLALGKCEDAICFFMKGSMISIEVEKTRA